MTTEFLLWLFPGYIIILFHRRISPHRNSSGWDFIGLVGFYAAISWGLVHFCQIFLRHIPYVNRLTVSVWREWLGITLPAGCALLPFATALALCWGLFVTRSRKVTQWAWNLASLDPLSLLMKQSIQNGKDFPVIVTMKSGKVYVGYVTAATFDRNETSKWFTMGVEFSGYREEDTQRVVLDKNYQPHKLKDPHEVSVCLPYAEIMIFARFSMQITERFVEAGLAHLGQIPKPGDVTNAQKEAEHSVPALAVERLAASAPVNTA